MVVNSLDLTMAAASDPTRRAMLARLAEGPASIHDLARPFRMSQQAVSKHVACLERARLIRKRREGRLRICTLNPAPLSELAGWAESFRELWKANYQRLDALLDEIKAQEKTRLRTPKRKRGDR
jgi:DNA-binding transcriptional ArsR family regulator